MFFQSTSHPPVWHLHYGGDRDSDQAGDRESETKATEVLQEADPETFHQSEAKAECGEAECQQPQEGKEGREEQVIHRQEEKFPQTKQVEHLPQRWAEGRLSNKEPIYGIDLF